MGAKSSKLKDPTGPDAREKYFGLENFGNTCYFNSVFQALFHCVSFREEVLRFYREQEDNPEDANLLMLLGDLFDTIDSNKDDAGVLQPTIFFEKVQELNVMFSGTEHQDAHEFLHFLFGELSDNLKSEHTKRNQQIGQETGRTEDSEGRAWLEELFEGVLTNHMQCLHCESITTRDERFLDLSVDIEDHTSIGHCLRQFSAPEMLCAREKFICASCRHPQEAYKWMQVKNQPRVLILHMKRFKYSEAIGDFTKLCHRVVFSEFLRLDNTLPGTEPSRLYELFAVVVHVGSGSTHGHYVSVVRKFGSWFLYDDESIEQLEDNCLQHFFGSMTDDNHYEGYMLFYQDVEEREYVKVEQPECETETIANS